MAVRDINPTQARSPPFPRALTSAFHIWLLARLPYRAPRPITTWRLSRENAVPHAFRLLRNKPPSPPRSSRPPRPVPTRTLLALSQLLALLAELAAEMLAVMRLLPENRPTASRRRSRVQIASARSRSVGPAHRCAGGIHHRLRSPMTKQPVFYTSEAFAHGLWTGFGRPAG